jgi:hypothetical protein
MISMVGIRLQAVDSRRRGVRPLAAVVLGLAALLVPAAAAQAKPKDGDMCARPANVGADAPNALRGICEYLDTRQGVVQVALFDATAERSYRVSTGDDKQYTASIVKVDILGRWLRRFQQQDAAIPGDIPYSIGYLLQRMIDNSDNAAATSLFYFGGGCDALTRFNELIPLKATDVACETPKYYGWGNTETTAADQVRLMRVFAYGDPDGVLGRDARKYGLGLMENVEPDQRFGITCGPWGTTCVKPDYAPPDPDVTVALKNGWKTLPTCTDPIDQCPWQVNSTGWVDGHGRDYVLTVLTTRDPVGTGGIYGFDYGIETIQGVSQLIWDNLAPSAGHGG